MPDPFSHHIIPIPDDQAEAGFEAYEVTHEFYEEVRVRTEFDEYCAWYYQIAAQHKQDLVTMRREFNLFSWFTGSKNYPSRRQKPV